MEIVYKKKEGLKPNGLIKVEFEELNLIIVRSKKILGKRIKNKAKNKYL